jgi:hypothetical protein
MSAQDIQSLVFAGIKNIFQPCTSFSDDIRLKKSSGSHREAKTRKKVTGRRKDESSRARNPQNLPSPYDADESDSEELPSGYHQVSIQVSNSVTVYSRI